MNITRVAALSAGAFALTAGSVGVFASPAGAEPPPNYGPCVEAGVINPSDGFWGPFNLNSLAQSGGATGAPLADFESGGNSRFVLGIACNF
jgi:hypothetical protein